MVTSYQENYFKKCEIFPIKSISGCIDILAESREKYDPNSS